MKQNNEGFGVIGILVGLVVVAVIGGVSFYVLSANKSGEPNGTQESTLIQECPDKWIHDRMPRIGEGNDPPAQYFIIDGQRKEIKDYDLEWVKANCSVKVQGVY